MSKRKIGSNRERILYAGNHFYTKVLKQRIVTMLTVFLTTLLTNDPLSFPRQTVPFKKKKKKHSPLIFNEC